MPEARPKFNQHSLLVILKMHLGQLTIMRGYIPPIQSFQICFRRFFQGCRIRSNRKTVRIYLDSHNSLSCSWSGSGTGAYCLDIRDHVSHNFGGLSSCIFRNDLHGIPKSSETLSWLKTWDKERITPEQLE